VAFEAGLTTGSVMASLVWLWLTKRQRRRQDARGVPLSFHGVAQERARSVGRCWDLGPTITRAESPPFWCVLDAGHTGSHTDGQGCEWVHGPPPPDPYAPAPRTPRSR
jgi:hypothetical protein